MVTTRRPNADTPARWDAALGRSLTEGVRVMQLPTTGVWVATSGTNADTAYVVTETDCECYAGAHGDPVCKHRAALRLRLQVLAGKAVSETGYTDNETGCTDAELDRMMAEPVLLMTFEEMERLIDGASVLSVASGSRTVATLPSHRMCTDCLDTGTARVYTGDGLNDWTPITCRCQRRAA